MAWSAGNGVGLNAVDGGRLRNMQAHGPVEALYRDFACYAIDSECFVDWAEGVLADAEVQRWIAGLPEGKRQPNLVFAAARWHGAEAPGPYGGLRAALLDDDGSIRATIEERSTQTNEVGRLATLVPAFAQVAAGRPLALVEVGASAGLCLYPDRWGYRWQTPGGLHALGPESPALDCAVTGPAPLPNELPQVAWRGGLDLHPLDVCDDDDVSWLKTLVWPEHDLRRSQLASAIHIARSDPPDVRTGDLRTDLPALVDEAAAAAPDAVVVVFHSAVIAYVDDEGTAAFEELMRGLVAEGRCHWVSNEGGSVLPGVSKDGPETPGGRFALAIDGRAVGHTHGHGRSLHWW